MATKSKELLTKAGQTATELLKAKGWKQKEYLSAGVIALSRLSPAEQLKCKELAYSKETENTDLHQAIKTVVRIMSGSGKDIQILPVEYDKLEEFVKETFGPKRKKLG